MVKDKLLTPQDVMQRYSIKETRTYNLFRESDFPTIRIGNRLFVRLEDLIDYENNHRYWLE
jgi:predicted DNA-binding transcriptional regulator AlpA